MVEAMKSRAAHAMGFPRKVMQYSQVHALYVTEMILMRLATW
jgi:hypothetical protein